MFQGNKLIEKGVIKLHSNKIYIVASTKNLRDVYVERVYDGNIFTLDTIVYGMTKKLQGKNIQVSVLNDNAFIDVVDENNELIKTYSIISKVVLLENK